MRPIVKYACYYTDGPVWIYADGRVRVRHRPHLDPSYAYTDLSARLTQILCVAIAQDNAEPTWWSPEDLPEVNELGYESDIHSRLLRQVYYAGFQRGIVCPRCLAANVQATSEITASTHKEANQSWRCANCGAKWIDRYMLMGYQEKTDEADPT